MKILVANLGSTSLKYRLFELGAGAETPARQGRARAGDRLRRRHRRLPGRAGARRVRCADRGDLAAVGFKTVLARGVTGCVRVDERGARGHGGLPGAGAGAQPALRHRHAAVRPAAARRAAGGALRDRLLPVGRPRPAIALRRARALVPGRRAPLRFPRRQPQVHRRALGRAAAGATDVARAGPPPLPGRRPRRRSPGPTCGSSPATWAAAPRSPASATAWPSAPAWG